MVDKMKSTTFERVDYDGWEDIAVKSLKGKPIKKLITETSEGIDIHPLYSLEQLENYDYKKTIQVIRSAKKQSHWLVAQKNYAKTSETFMKELQASLARGNETIVYDGSINFDWQAEDLDKLAKLMETHPFYIQDVKQDDLFWSVFERIPKHVRKRVKGYISGLVDNDILSDFDNVRTIHADVRDAHLDGADAVTELALALAMAAERAMAFKSFDQFAKKFYVQFAVDTHFFMEIAKLRAFRMLWKAFTSAYDDEFFEPIPVISENSLRSYSKLDPYVNLLRAGNEALSAALGGTNVLTVHPHDLLTEPTPSSIRLARNVQLVIKEETYVQNVIDPAGGSFFVEALTNELIKKAWALFQKIEELGGYQAYLSSDEWARRINALRAGRQNQLATGKFSLIGTNKYANLEDKVSESKACYKVNHRLAEAYETYRSYFQKSQPNIKLLVLGDLKDHKPRADFVSGFLAAGGLKTEWSPAFYAVHEALEWIKQETFDYGIICGKDEVVIDMMDELLETVNNDYHLDVAGRYDKALEEKWLQLGLHGFIYQGQNQLDKIEEIKKFWMGAIKHEEA